LESSGELSFDAPDRLEKRTIKPRPDALLLDGDKLTVTMHESDRSTCVCKTILKLPL
jgi:hypothetical protein